MLRLKKRVIYFVRYIYAILNNNTARANSGGIVLVFILYSLLLLAAGAYEQGSAEECHRG